jgi:hypothetical protein
MAGFDNRNLRLCPPGHRRRRHDEHGIKPSAEDLAHGTRHGDGGLARADGDHLCNTAQVIQAAVNAQGLTPKRQRPPNGEGGGGRVERGQQDATQRCPDG